MTDEQEELGQIIDRLDSVTSGLIIPLPDRNHVQILRTLLPEIVQELRAVFEKVTGENPWK